MYNVSVICIMGSSVAVPFKLHDNDEQHYQSKAVIMPLIHDVRPLLQDWHHDLFFSRRWYLSLQSQIDQLPGKPGQVQRIENWFPWQKSSKTVLWLCAVLNIVILFLSKFWSLFHYFILFFHQCCPHCCQCESLVIWFSAVSVNTETRADYDNIFRCPKASRPSLCSQREQLHQIINIRDL